MRLQRLAGLGPPGPRPGRPGRLEVEIRLLISLAAWAERWASARTSEATTAKPLAGVAGPGASTPGVEGQEVGLEGDLVDHADDLG